MKLYIRRKNTTFNDIEVFSVATAAGKMKYDLKIGVLLGKKIRLVDADKNEVAVIKQVLKSLMPKYDIFIGDEKLLTVSKKLHILPKFELDGGWEVKYGMMVHNFELLKNGTVVARISDQDMPWGEAYEIDIPEARWEIPAVALAVAIECGIGAEKCLRRPEDNDQ